MTVHNDTGTGDVRPGGFETRIHGRGGQGTVTAAELLSVAAFEDGLYAQSFPSFGSERMGAPVGRLLPDRPTIPSAPASRWSTRRPDRPGSDPRPPGGPVRRVRARRVRAGELVGGPTSWASAGGRRPARAAADRAGHRARPRAPGAQRAELGPARRVRRPHRRGDAGRDAPAMRAALPGAVGEHERDDGGGGLRLRRRGGGGGPACCRRLRGPRPSPGRWPGAGPTWSPPIPSPPRPTSSRPSAPW